MNKDELFRINTMYCANYFNTVTSKASDKTFKQAWEIVENERIEIGLPERYTSYDSFRKAFHFHTNKMLSNHKQKRNGQINDRSK
jgi:hypothetical protein